MKRKIEKKYGVERNRILLYDYITRAELEVLLKSYYCLLFPSLSEGFGYPPLEAIRYGKPVIGSAVTSLPEIYQNSMLINNPLSVEEIASRIKQIIDNSELREELSELGRRRYGYLCRTLKNNEDTLVRAILDLNIRGAV